MQVLIVDDFEPFRRFLCSTLQKVPNLRIVAEASDGLEALQKLQELQPDLVLLDVGLPSLCGLEVARRTHELSPKTRILMISQNSSVEVIQEAFNEGACGYVIKSDARDELLEAVSAVLGGDHFISKRLMPLCTPANQIHIPSI